MKRSIALLTVGLLALTLGGCKKKAQTEPQFVQEETTVETKAQGMRSLTTGRQVEKRNYPIVVSIPNDATGRPHTNISKADVVYEVYAEGGITRLLALYADEIPEKVGPVRSGRIYMIDIVDDWQAAFVHYGGSTGGAVDLPSKIKKSKIEFELDGMTDTTYIKRDNSRQAPNNAYVYLTKYADQVIQQKAAVESGPFRFDDQAGKNGSAVSSITIPYSSANSVSYAYDSGESVYKRLIGGRAYNDAADGKQVTVKNVIVQQVKQTDYNDSGKHINLQMTGSGKATFYVGGKKMEGTWERRSASVSTVYKDSQGKEITLLPGNTWVQVVTNQIDVSEK